MKCSALKIVYLIILSVIIALLWVKYSSLLIKSNNQSNEIKANYGISNTIDKLYYYRRMQTKSANNVWIGKKQQVTVCVVSCGEDQLAVTVTALQSAIIFSRSPITLIVFADPRNFTVFRKMHSNWPIPIRDRVNLSLLELRYPDFVNQKEWKTLFKQCASLRLFLPSLLPDTDAVLYIDGDVMFLSPPEDVWQHLYSMNSSQLAALAPEHEDFSVGWYNRFAKHPYYGKLGLNSGVMLMNLTRMRAFGWHEHIVPLKAEYEPHIRWGDQDLLNILFHFHPEFVLELDCSYNYRPDHCMYSSGGRGSGCSPAEQWGVRVLHANRRAAHTDKFPPFRIIYQAISQSQADVNGQFSDVYDRVSRGLLHDTSSRCGARPHVFLKRLQQQLRAADAAR